jgi:hypothetical protein
MVARFVYEKFLGFESAGVKSPASTPDDLASKSVGSAIGTGNRVRIGDELTA